MLRSKLLFSIVVGISSTVTQPAFANSGSELSKSNRCQTFFSFNSGFRAADDGKVTLRLAESKHALVEKSANAVANFILGRALNLDEISRVTKRFLEDKSGDPFFMRLGRAFELSIKIENMSDFTKMIPEKGGVVVFANHPNNGRETIALAAAISIVRPDTKVALTALLKDFPEMDQAAFLMQLSGSAAAKEANRLERKKMDDWVKDGHVVIIHPSGEVSLNRHGQPDFPMDSEWKYGTAKLLESNPEAQLVLAYMDGQSSSTFQKIKHLKPHIIGDVLGPVFHVREIGNGTNAQFPVNMAAAVKVSDVLQLAKNEDGSSDLMKMMQILRAKTYALKGKFERKADERKMEEIAPKTNPDLVRADISKMQFLVEERGLQVYIGQGRDIPNVVREMGRLREINFRKANEGSGKAIDTDAYDSHYHHIVMINPETGTILGGYRLAFTDKVIKQHGLKGIYNLNLFEYSNLILPEGASLSKSIELGRSFVNFHAVEPQDIAKLRVVLTITWKAIARVIEQNPEYTHLTGPVSISNAFSDVSKAIIAQYYMSREASDMKAHVTPRTRFVPKSPVLAEALALVPTLKTQADLFSLIKDIDGEVLPTLLKSYGSLGAKYLGFNFDPDFNTVDGMIVVDLRKSDRKELAKYFTPEGLNQYLRLHGVE